MKPATDNRRGIAAMLMAVGAFLTGDVVLRLTAETLPIGEIMALRGLAATAILATFVAATSDLGTVLRHAARPLLLARGAVEGLVAMTFIAALPGLLFADINAIILSSALLSTGVAAALGLEKVGVRRWAALIVGFAGVVVVLRPTLSGVSVAALLALACSFLVSVRDLMTTRMRDQIPTVAITLATTALVAATGFLLGLVEPGWRWPTQRETLMLGVAACTVSFGNFMIIAAFRGTDIAVVTPFRYTSLVFASLYGFLVWGELPDRWTLIGGALIVASGVYTIWRERVRAREKPVTSLAT